MPTSCHHLVTFLCQWTSDLSAWFQLAFQHAIKWNAIYQVTFRCVRWANTIGRWLRQKWLCNLYEVNSHGRNHIQCACKFYFFLVLPTKRQWRNVFLVYIKSFPNVYYLRWSVSSLPAFVDFFLSLQGLFWALACNYMLYDNIKLPHIKGEPFTGNSSYVPIYTNYMPTEFLINGIVSGLLTVVNVMCIFITAIIVLKIKEVAAPYTSSPDLRR